jgi:hypothetical protein
MCTTTIDKYGATPANIKWTVVRGDSANLKIEFFEDDEVTEYDTTDWTYTATAYDPSGQVLDDLPVIPGTWLWRNSDTSFNYRKLGYSI